MNPPFSPQRIGPFSTHFDSSLDAELLHSVTAVKLMTWGGEIFVGTKLELFLAWCRDAGIGGISSLLQTNTTQREANILSPSRCSVLVDWKGVGGVASMWLTSSLPPKHTNNKKEKNHLLPSLSYTRVFTYIHTHTHKSTQIDQQTLFLFLVSACKEGEAEIYPR